MHTLIVTDRSALIAALAHYAETDGLMSVPAIATGPGDVDGRELLALLHEGWSCRTIAGQLGICVPTVKARLMRLYRQTGQHRWMSPPSRR